MRFWRTLCLNYENSRHWRDDEDQIKRAKGHLDNLKLKFSRLNICYSYIAHLLSQGAALTKENALATSSLTPFERLHEIEKNYPDMATTIKIMRTEYMWFLDITDKSRDDALDWISDTKNRDEAFRHAGIFVSKMGSLVQQIAEKNDYLRYLIV